MQFPDFHGHRAQEIEALSNPFEIEVSLAGTNDGRAGAPQRPGCSHGSRHHGRERQLEFFHPNAPGPGGTVSAAGADVIIDARHSVTVSAVVANSPNTLTINGATLVRGTLAITSATGGSKGMCLCDSVQ